MPRYALRLFGILLFLSALVVGCSASSSPAATPATGQQSSGTQQATATPSQQSGGKVTLPGTDGVALTVDSNLPDELKSFPVPQGFTSEGGGTMSSGGDKFFAYSWKGSGQVQATMDFYKTSMPGQGWNEESSFSSSDGGMLNYTKPGGLGLTVTVSQDPSTKEITVAALLGVSSTTPTPQPTARAQTPAGTPAPGNTAPQATSTPSAPATTDSSSLPAELKGIPVPAGFAMMKDSSYRLESGGVFQAAAAQFFGTAPVGDAVTFLKTTVPAKGWSIDTEIGGQSEYSMICSNTADPSLTLSITVSTVDAGTEIMMQVSKVG